MKRINVRKQMLRFLTSLTSGLFIFLYSSNCIAESPRAMARTTSSIAKITVKLFAAEDSAGVVQYSASVSDASTGTTLDSLGSGTSNMIAFNVTATGVSEASSTIPSNYNLDQSRIPKIRNIYSVLSKHELGAHMEMTLSCRQSANRKRISVSIITNVNR